MKLAIEEAGIAPADVDYINAHGTSTHHNDLFETRAIKYAMGDAAYNVNINSTKSMIGHLFGAAGAVEFITCVKSIEDSYIHPTVGLRETEVRWISTIQWERAYIRILHMRSATLWDSADTMQVYL